MANIASIGTLMMATTHRLHTLSPSTSAADLVAITSDLRRAADALKEAEATWKRVTTLQPQGRAFGAASFELFDTLRTVVAMPAEPEKQRALGLDTDQSIPSLERGIRDLANFVEQSHDATRACLNSELLFAPARSLDHSAEHLQSRTRGGYLPVAADAATVVLNPIEIAGSRTAQVVASATERWPAHRSLVVTR